jgi:AraC-like DNA-binding protein
VAIINSNVIHYAEASGYCELQSLVFSPLLLTGSINSSFATKYITPLLSCEARSSVVNFSQKTDIVQHFSAAFEALKTDAFGYEFIVREHLSHIMLILFKEYEDQLQLPARNVRQDSIRLEQMLKYIHEHYTEDITLNKISRVSAIGERECLRCFKRTIGESPIQYLLKYRLMQSATRLISEPDVSISHIAMTCGFDSPSYYSKQFKRYYKCAPKKYRDNKNMTVRQEACSKNIIVK